jgi:class 3 adenylate cyclase
MKSNFSEIYKPWQIAIFISIVGVVLSTSTGYFLEGKIIFRQIYMPIIIGGPVSYFFYRSIWKYKNLLNKINVDLESARRQVLYEKDKSDKLLLNVLPTQIANRLILGESPIADHFEEASVIFIDIADFTKLSAKSTPQKMVKMLNDVFTIFDKVSAKYGIEKIKTIGDCYMAASGIPVPRADHAQAISMMALDAMEAMKIYRTEDGHEIQFRIGLDCGPIVAGVIGEQKFIYDLWGDMVNTASRMETNGIIGKIQCTERFRNKLNTSTPLIPRQRGTEIAYPPLEGAGGGQLGISFVERGEIEIKGKGMMKTYFLEKILGDE